MEQPISVSPQNNLGQANNQNFNAPKPKSKKWLWWIIVLAVIAFGSVMLQNMRKVTFIQKATKAKFNKASVKPVASKNLEEMVVPEGFPKNFPFDKLAEEKVSLNQTDTYSGSIVSERASQTAKTPNEVTEILEKFFVENKWQYQKDPGNSEISQTIIAFDGLGGSITVTAKLDSATARTDVSFYANKLTTTK